LGTIAIREVDRGNQGLDQRVGVSERAMRVLPFMLSVIAGSTDIIGFLGLNGLFTAHITGNIVVLAAHIVAGDPAVVSYLLSVPVFMVVLGLTRLLAEGFEAIGLPTLQPLLSLQFVLLAGFLVLGVASRPAGDPNAVIAIVAGMFGVSAMAVQNALVQIAMPGLPSTAVMTSNVTRFMIELGALLVARDRDQLAVARRRTKELWPPIVGFIVGCSIGAAGQAAYGLWSLALPTGLALIVFATSLAKRSLQSRYG
jgi:uncharacterized membrane protein YoaK (UPF0700 family)